MSDMDYINDELIHSNLKGFEQLLGYKFGCLNCKFRVVTNYCELKGKYVSITKNCDKIQLTDECITSIKKRDKEIIDTKNDTHPKYCIGLNYLHEYLLPFKLKIIL